MVNMTFKKYTSYIDYLNIQKKKLGTLDSKWISEYDNKYFTALSERLAGIDLKGKSVLCLAARFGTEVRAFINKGAFAVGIDLETGIRNRFVITGDFHDIQYPNECVDYVFTNSLDHSFDLEKVISEVYRVLNSGGIFITETVNGIREGVPAGEYECAIWDKVEELKPFFSKFRIISQKDFTYPWKGVQFIMSKEVK